MTDLEESASGNQMFTVFTIEKNERDLEILKS
jgi:hypothetical protein